MSATTPPFTLADAERFAADHFGLTGRAEALDSYADQNFKLTCADATYVLKIANRTQNADALIFQSDLLQYLARCLPDMVLPRLYGDDEGRTVVPVVDEAGATYLMRCVSYVPGQVLAECKQLPRDVLGDLGRFFGRLNRATEGFRHPHMVRDDAWDLANGATVCRDLCDGLEASERGLVTAVLERYEQQVRPHLPALRRAVIHNDGNDYNILVDGGRISGLIDFGDAIFSHTINELAIVCTYAVLGEAQPLHSAARIVAGYHGVYPLTELELSLVFDLIQLRMATSLCHAARAMQADPDNAYLGVHAQPIRAALAKLADVHSGFATCVFRAACGLDPSPLATRVTAFLQRQSQVASVLDAALLARGTVTFDLTRGGADYGTAAQRASTESFTAFLFEKLTAADVAVGLGRYNEDRDLYCDPGYDLADCERRSVHLGIDLYAAAGTTVYAPLAGVVHAVADNNAAGDYGPTLILRHETDTGDSFYTLYGHLGRGCLTERRVGESIAAGAALAVLGDIHENGSWPPHLHFQMMVDLFGWVGDYPGIARYHERRLWLSLVPDPNVILRLPTLGGGGRADRQALQRKRGQVLAPNFSLSYREPLHIVRGEGCYLFDADGRAYLDMVNNVCHVGHCHPHVVAAAQKQLALLNTNTRYLHENILTYAERLTATMPGDLSVCFFTCTGSEANDLALRLARTATGRRDILCLDAAYHGHTQALIEISPYKYEGRGGFDAPASTFKLPMPDVYRGPYKRGEADLGARYAAAVQPLLAQMSQGPAAVIAESLLGCGGQIVLPDGYLTELYRWVRAAGGVCIADEVQVGFGRVGNAMWGFQTQGVVPDIVTLGKPIGNGFPMAAVITTPAIAAAFHNGMEYFNTFGGNPVSCAVGAAVLDVIEQEHLQQHALQVGDYLKQGLSALQQRHALIGDVRGLGLFLGVELVRDRTTLTPADREASDIVEAMKQRGVLLSVDGPLYNVLKIKPPLVFSRDDADLALTALDEVLAQLG